MIVWASKDWRLSSITVVVNVLLLDCVLHMYLSSSSPGFESQAHNLCLLGDVFSNYYFPSNCENEQKNRK